MTSAFLRDFFAGRKQLFKIKEIVLVKRIWSFKETTTQKVIDSYPEPAKAILYLPNVSNFQKLDKEYAFNVS